MNRTAKISLLKAVKCGETSIREILLKGAICPPTWLLNQFETPDELYKDLKKTWGDAVLVIKNKDKVLIAPSKVEKGKWFNYE